MLWRLPLKGTPKEAIGLATFSSFHLLFEYLLQSYTSVFVLRTIVFALGWSLRSRLDPTRWQDLVFFIFLVSWKTNTTLDLAWLSTIVPSFSSATSATIVLIAAIGAVLVLLLTPPDSYNSDTPSNDRIPHILPSRTTHSRFFPKKHSFSYSYLQVSIPVEFEGRCGSLMSVGETERKAWFHVQASDHLDRTSEKLGLKSKLCTYLQSQGVEDADWDHANLITAPRFLGYSFNPVSFWYIYRKGGSLSMMILEVNNTFDERRMYLLRSGEIDEDVIENGKDLKEPVQAPSNRFKNEWAKDFHVSPFNSRKGYYSLSAVDPFGVGSPKPPIFDSTIVLKSSKGYPKLVARIFSDGVAVNPLTASNLDVVRVLLGWCWVGFLTSPRILKEAFVLYFKRNLHVWLRPEVLSTSIGRNATSIERSLEPFFARYLEELVNRANRHLRVVYNSGFDALPTHIVSSKQSNKAKYGHVEAETLEIRVLSPAFFSRFVHYAHLPEGFEREAIFTDEKNRTAWIPRPDLLSVILTEVKSIDFEALHFRSSPLDRFRWAIHRQLRCPPVLPAYLIKSAPDEIEAIRSFGLSDFDCFILSDSSDSWIYRRACTRLFLAQRFTLGFTEIIDLLDLAFRFILASIAVYCVTNASTFSKSPLKSDMLWTMGMPLLINLLHWWSELKGAP